MLLVGASEHENEWIGTGLLLLDFGNRSARLMSEWTVALAEHAEISGIEKAKGLHIITTESATSSARYRIVTCLKLHTVVDF